jgi:F-type H+-transporting ATPase subunit delta
VIGVVAKRYARALVELSEEKKITEKVRADLAAFADAAGTQQDIQKLFSSPAFTPEDKKAVIREISSRLQLHPISQRFIEHLADVGRIRHLQDVHQAFEDLLAERENRAKARLATASPVNDGTIAEIKKGLEAITGKQVDIDAQIDPALIGGAKAQIGSVIYDGSIRNQLNKMREHLVK